MNTQIAAIVGMGLVVSISHAQSWGQWQPEPSLPTGGIAKTHAIGLEVNGTFFVLGGPPWVIPGDMEDGSVYSMLLGGNSWNEEIGFDGYGGVLGQGGGVDDLGRIIIFGGDFPNNPGFDKPPFEWNQEEGPWHEHADRGSQAPATNFAYCTDASSRIYSIGGGRGEDASTSNPNSSYCERFIGSTDIWESIAPMPIGVANAAASPDGLGHILVFGGIVADGSIRTDAVLSYDIASNTWSSIANTPMPIALSDHQATLGADGRVYILGGSSGPIGSETVEQGVHVYDPTIDQWFIGPDMSEPRRFFTSFLGSDDRLYVAGGDNGSGGTDSVESIFTTPCPIFVTQPSETIELWENTTIGLSAEVIGGGTITYQWMHDDQPLVDGASIGGSVVSGSQSDTLTISSSSELDEGQYTLVATNSCGSVESASSQVTIRIPPTIPTNWTWTSLHPSYARSSYAYGVDNGVQVGNAVFDTPEYNNIDHPFKWTGTASSAVNLTPGGSQGGNISDFAGDKIVGWWWEPLQCYVGSQWQTCYYRRGGWWNLDGTFHATNYSGFEYTIMTGTDGVSIVGSGSTDDAVGNVFTRAVIWQAPTHQFAQSIHPSGFTDSSAIAVDGEHQFGTVSLPFQGIHAAMWSGSAASFVDLHPEGYINSVISDASDGQQVGVVNQWHDPHAVIWSSSPGSLVDLNPAGATTSSAIACESGLQIGTVIFPDNPQSIPVIWAGSADSFTDLSGIIPEGYTNFLMSAIDVGPDGTISIVGSSYNPGLSRYEAILVTSTIAPVCRADLNADGVLDFFDISSFLTAFGVSDPAADFSGDGMFDFFDISGFLTEYAAGCP